MRYWVISEEGNRWSVKLDLRDHGGHLDTPVRAWDATLAARVSCAGRVSAMPLDIHGKLRVRHPKFITAALH